MARMERSLRSGNLSDSFGNLLNLARTFDSIPRGAGARRNAVKAVESLGPTAVPLLARMLRTGDDRQTDWASYLVARGGGSRALSALRAMSDDGQLPGPRGDPVGRAE